MKAPDDKPSIGLLLCKSKNTVIAEDALRDSTKPIGIAEFDLLRNLPLALADNLPSIEGIEAELAGEILPEDESHE